MRRIFIFIAFALCSLWQLRAQADTASFLFDKYEDAQVLLRAGGELKSKMNYSIVVNKFYFIDPQDKQVKELANPGDILLIKIAGRTFYPESNGAGIEMLPTKPVVYVQYKATARKEAPMGAYGTRSETTAVQSYGTITSNGQSYKLEGEKVFDYIFLDPPYDRGFEKRVLEYLSDSSLVYEDTQIIVEASKETDFSYLQDLGFEIIREKTYKTNKHLFIEKAGKEEVC